MPRRKKPGTPRESRAGLRKPFTATLNVSSGEESPNNILGAIMKTMLSIIALALLAAGVAVAGEPRGVQRIEVTYVLDPIYVPCLGAEVWGIESAVLWRQNFSAPVSEVQHVAVHVQGQMELQDASGNTWIGHEDVSWVGNMSKGASNRYVDNIVFKPVFGDGPMWVLHTTGKLTMNANGEVIIDRYASDNLVVRCLSAKSE